MKTLYLDCGMGAAGDMLSAALAGLLPDPDGFVDKLNALGIPGVRYELIPAEKCGITGLRMSVTVDGREEDEYYHAHEHHHEHSHEHDHKDDHEHHHEENPEEHHHEHHHHSGLGEIEHILSHTSLPEGAAKNVMEVYRIIAAAESKAHGVPVELVHFHEVGALDAVADIAAVCLMIEEISPERVVVSPINTGFGKVKCAHGILPVPAPATAEILREMPIYSGRFEGEMCTPTGAALLKKFATEFGQMPVMRVEKIGYGMGKKDFEAANCVRAMLGETEAESGGVTELCCNIDDMTAEEIGFACEELLRGGALEVFTVPCMMKKFRQGTLLTVLCRPEDREKTAAEIFRLTETIGIRESYKTRRTLKRSVGTVGGARVKISEGEGVKRSKVEYDDAAALAREKGLSLREARRELERGE